MTKKDLDVVFYTLQEVSQILDITNRTLLDYLKDGSIKGKKIGGKWTITKENLENFIKGTDNDTLEKRINDYIEYLNERYEYFQTLERAGQKDIYIFDELERIEKILKGLLKGDKKPIEYTYNINRGEVTIIKK